MIPKDVFLKSKPLRNPYVKWERYPSGEIAILIERKETKFTKLLSKITHVPKYKKLVLDRIGSKVWELCDGEHTVEDIVNFLCEEYKLNRREAEVSLTVYLQNLMKRGLIGLRPPSELLSCLLYTSPSPRD